MNLLYAVLPWGIIGLGVLHMAATWRLYDVTLLSLIRAGPSIEQRPNLDS